jgi:hypothetical protein
MTGMMRRLSFVGIVLFIVPVFCIALEGSGTSKSDAYGALLVSISGLLVATIAALHLHFVRRMERLKK